MEGHTSLVSVLLKEGGGHRWQRVPPTERKGRIHTSTVTVAVFELVQEQLWILKEKDIQTFVTKGSGPGGQHRNKTESCVTLRHTPTGIEAKADMRSQFTSKRMAREVLETRVADFYQSSQRNHLQSNRKTQIGSGMRGDKIRTYREQDDLVIDHLSNKKERLSHVLKGGIDKILDK